MLLVPVDALLGVVFLGLAALLGLEVLQLLLVLWGELVLILAVHQPLQFAHLFETGLVLVLHALEARPFVLLLSGELLLRLQVLQPVQQLFILLGLGQLVT